MSKLSRWTTSVLCIAFSASTLWGQTPNPQNPPALDPTPKTTTPPPKDVPPPVRPTGTAAVVNKQEVPEVAVARALLGVDSRNRTQARTEILNFLIDNALIDQYLAHLKITVDPKEVDKQLSEFREEVKKAGQDYAKVLARLMLTEDELKEQIAGQVRWDKFVNQQAPEATLKKYFESNLDMFDGTMVRARHILMTAKDESAKAETMKQLVALKAKIEQDVAQAMTKVPTPATNLEKEQKRIEAMIRAFSDVAKEKSACPSNRDGGDLGWFPRVGSMVEPFAQAAFALKPYQLSDVVTTEFGYHLVLVTDRKPGTETKFDDQKVKEAVKDVYGGKLREKVVEMMRKQAKIEITPKTN